MEGLSRGLAAPVSFEVDGKTYLFKPVSLTAYGEIEQYILKGRPNPVEAIQPYLADLDETSRAILLKEAYKDLRNGNKVSAVEIAEFIDSFNGICFTAWVCLRDNHPEIDSPEAATVLVNKMGEDAMRKLAEQASGTNKAGNSTGPTQNKAPGNIADQTNTPRGEESSDSSQKNTDGPLPKSES